jgi:hypothetical protein
MIKNPLDSFLSPDVLTDPSPAERMRAQNMLQAIEYLHHQNLLNPNIEAVQVAGLLPVRVYLQHEYSEATATVNSGINRIALAFALDIMCEFREIRGPWFKTWIMKVRGATSPCEVAVRLKTLERAVELHAPDIPEAQVDPEQAHAVAELLRAVGSTPDALIQIGPLLIVKQASNEGSTTCVRTLTPELLKKLESDPSLLSSRNTFLDIVARKPLAYEEKSRGRDNAPG